MQRPGPSSAKLEVPTSDESALYRNFCILGLHLALRQEGFELSPTCFRRSNNKALEHVLYRLFTLIEGKQRASKVRRRRCSWCPRVWDWNEAREACNYSSCRDGSQDFKDKWPVLDKVQQTPFYQVGGECGGGFPGLWGSAPSVPPTSCHPDPGTALQNQLMR